MLENMNIEHMGDYMAGKKKCLIDNFDMKKSG
jgi:hypothetical protein